ncbi:cell envelope integrity protein CreD [Uliginosibacterium sp. sgz301328]|uniref:cell envelope integrity protein CreD n=1 Tax=Uliginosibacterium sp. sgz301328 TaxID=3243764 RepID=UPI00359D5A14
MKTLFGKAFVLIMLIVALSIGVMSVRSTIGERLSYREEALDSVTASLPRDQRIAGLVLVQTYTERYLAIEDVTDAAGKRSRRQVTREQTHDYIVLPESLDVTGSLMPDQRRIGLFRIMAYQFDGHLKGSLRVPGATDLPRTRSDSQIVAMARPRLMLTLSDTRGLREVKIAVDGKDLAVKPGEGLGEAASLQTTVPDEALKSGTLSFDTTLVIGGTGRFNLVPLAQQNRMAISSPWAHPSFIGDFLPVERNIRQTGFDALWQTSSLATSAGRVWLNAVQRASEERGVRDAADTFSVQLVEPVDIYSLADRATKYAFMFIMLTLGIFMIYELMKQMRVHAIQYLLVGAAQLIFFLLLLALSEHIGFATAYLAATVACVGLIGYYIAAVLKSAWRGTGFAALLALLYGALYGILQSEQNALLLGSTLVFVVLAAVMIATRRTDWHALTHIELPRRPARRAPAAEPASTPE